MNNTTCPPGPCDHWFVYFGEAVIQPTLLAIGILTNTASLIILPGSRIVETFKICLIALAMSDLCATTTGFAQMLVEVLAYDGNVPFGYWEKPAVVSYSLYFVYILFMCTSAGLVILIVLIRSMIVSKPMKARRFLTKSRTRILCCCVFLVTALLYSPTTLNILWQACHKDRGGNTTNTCDTGRDTNGTPFCVQLFHSLPNLETVSNSYLYTMSVLYGPLLVLVYVICFIGIKVSLNKTTKLIQSLSQRKDSIHPGGTAHRTNKKHLSKTARITRTLLVILVLDTICTLPAVIQGIGLIAEPSTTIFHNNTCWYDIFDVVAEIFLCLRPTYNFWLYVYSHREFRGRCRYQLLRLRYFCCRGVCNLEHKPREYDSSLGTHDSPGTGSRLRSRNSTPDHGSRTSLSPSQSTSSLNRASHPQTKTKNRKSKIPQFTRQGSWARMSMLKSTFRGRGSNNRDFEVNGDADHKSSGKKESKDLPGTTYVAADAVDTDTTL